MSEKKSSRRKALLRSNACEEEQDMDDNEEVGGELLEKYNKMRVKRRKVAEELLDTEKTYVESLEILKKVYYDPMSAKSKQKEGVKVISADDVRTIFGSLNIILPVNKLFLSDLSKRLSVTPDQELLIGDAFHSFAFSLRSYTAFINDFENTRKLLTNLKKDEQFLRFFENIQSENKEILGNKTLNDFMILPVQRIPRYKMLLNELFKNTWEGHEDYEKLKKAIENVCETAQLVEDAQEKVFNINKIIAIQSTLKMSKRMEKEVGKLLQPHRIFQKEGLLKLNLLVPNSSTPSANDQSVEANLHLRKIILFNDLLLIAKSGDSAKEKKKKNELSTIKKAFFIIQMRHVIKSSSIEVQPALALEFEDGNTVQLFISSQKEADEWYAAFANAQVHEKQNAKSRESKKKGPRGSTIISSSERQSALISANSTANIPTSNSGSNLTGMSVTNKMGEWSRTMTLKRNRKSTAQQPTQQQYINPLFGQQNKMKRNDSTIGPRRGTLNGNIANLQSIDEELVKKSPSMNAIQSTSMTPTNEGRWEDEEPPKPAKITSTSPSREEKRKNFSRSPSVDSLGKIQANAASNAQAKNLSNLQFD